MRFLRNHMSVIVDIINNNTVLQCYLLWIFVSIRTLPPHLKNIIPSFAKSPLKSTNYINPLFRRFTFPPKKKLFKSPSLLFRFSIVCQEVLYLSSFFCSDELCLLKLKQVIASWIWNLIVFLGVLFHISAIMR